MTASGSLPPEVLRALLQRTLIPGAIIHLFCPFTNPPKDKFLLLVCADPNPVVFIINSTPHPFILERFMDLQIPLDPSVYTFLDRTSYIDCSSPKDSLTMEELVEMIMRDRTAGWRMEINDQTRAAVVGAISRNVTLSPIMRKRLLAGLDRETPEAPEPPADA